MSWNFVYIAYLLLSVYTTCKKTKKKTKHKNSISNIHNKLILHMLLIKVYWFISIEAS